jgi:UDP-N-acetylmuramyl pentapeptide synthase
MNEIGNILKADDCVLIKASRSYKFEDIFEKIKEEKGE